MYRSKLRIALLNVPDSCARAITEIEPKESFENIVSEVSTLDDAAIATADIIVASTDGDTASLIEGIEKAAPQAETVLLASSEQIEDAYQFLDSVKDLWLFPMDAREVSYRFDRLLQEHKDKADAWEARQFWETTINSIPSMVWYKSADGIHHKVNDAFCRSAGKEKSDIEGRGHAYIWDVESDDPACVESERRVMDTETTVVSEEAVKTGDGARLFTTYKSPLYNIDGTTMGTVGVGIDVTKERAYEKEILDKNKTLEAIFTSLQCGVLTHSLDGSRIIGVNQAALDILGYKDEQEMLTDGFDMVAATVIPEDASRMRAEMANLTVVGESVNTEYRVKHRNGEIVHVLGNVKLIEHDGKKLYQRFLLDYTDKKLEETLKEREQRELVQALSEDYLLVCSFNLDTGKGQTLRIESDEKTHLESYFSKELNLGTCIGAYIDDAVTKDDRAMLRSSLSAANLIEELTSSKRIQINYRTDRDGKIEYCQATVVRTGNWDDGKRDIVIGFRNVDQQTRSEMRKKALLEEALASANKASEAKSNFLSSMSHDIRTPMNAIVGFTTLAQTRIDQPDKVLEYLDKIQTSSAHLLSLINDILDMSRIESGKVLLDEQPCNIESLLQELHSIMQSELDAHRLDYSLDVSSLTSPNVLCDKLRISQVMLNILGNAIKFTEPGGSIKVAVKQLPGNAHGYGRYRFSISDTGIGMDEEFMKSVFDPFERERTSTISGLEGSGLGMAITKNLIDMMNGTISVESEKGVGTTFTIDLALRLDDGNREELSDTVQQECIQPNHSMRGSHILLVDDNALNREIAITLLEDEGFTVEYAVNGQEAVDKLVEAGEGHFQLILMDIQMPVMNGYEAAKAIRQLDNTELASIPIIAMTADAFEEDRQKALRSGMDGHLTKPIEIEKLFDTLNSILC